MMHSLMIAPPVVAAGIDWLEGLLPVLFVLFWIVSQVWNVIRRVNGRPAVPPPLPERRPAPPPAGRPPDISREIEEFLRQARERRPADQRPATRPQPQAAPQPPAKQQPPRPKQQPRQPAAATAPAAAPSHGVEPDRVEPGRVDAGRDRMVGTLDGRETQVARHVHDVFAHELRHLAPGLPDAAARDAAAPRPRMSQAEELAHLLRSPASMRQVILLREVIDRPTHRW